MGGCVSPITPRRIPMSCHPRVTEWTTIIQAHLPHLSKPQATVLALWSLGMVLARSCPLPAVSAFLATWLGRKEPAVYQQLREFCYETAAKRGPSRCALAVEPCFVPLLAWVVEQWEGTQLALALDATTLGTRFTVLAISVVYRGCAIPVAWTVLPATAKHAWRREWLRMLRQVRRAVPRSWTVIVLADRGLYARWLFRRITRLGWHPVLRINTGGSLRPAGATCWRPLMTFVPRPGTSWRGVGLAFTRNPVACTLLARWEDGYKDPWLSLTDLAPEASDAGWYGLRAWIEQGFKITKRAGWQWHRTRMSAPDRAARLWLAVAVATLWLLSVGGGGARRVPPRTLLDVAGWGPGGPRTPRGGGPPGGGGGFPRGGGGWGGRGGPRARTP